LLLTLTLTLILIFDFSTQNHTTCKISLYQVRTLSDHSFLSYATDKQTDKQTDLKILFTPIDIVGVGNNRENKLRMHILFITYSLASIQCRAVIRFGIYPASVWTVCCQRPPSIIIVNTCRPTCTSHGTNLCYWIYTPRHLQRSQPDNNVTRRMAIANGTCVSFCNQPKAAVTP